MAVETEFTPSIVVDDDCTNKKDLSLSLMGRVKEMASLANLKKVLCNEGFDTLKNSYLGELWVLLEFESSKVKELFRHNAGAGSWFSVLQQANADFVPDGRLVWVEVRQNIHESFKVVFRGKVHWVRAIEVPGWTPEFNEEEEEDDISVEGNFDAKPEAQEANNVFDESDVEEVLETEFDVPSGKKDNQSEDPFGLYPLLQKENINMARKVNEEVHSLSHPPGFTPKGDLFEGKSMGGNAEKVYEEKEKGENSFVNNDIGGSILNLMEEVVKVGQTMRYNMEGCIKDITDIIESQGEFGETKMGFMDLNTVRSCWGNSIFENSFTRSDYFVIIRGVWLKSGIDLLIVVVYAPQETKEKRMLWEYLAHISNSWDGKIVMMGGFNEVRHKSDRFGSNFNVHDAEIFNSFIYNAGIEEVPLGGSAFTWCHKSASKMSNLDPFFVSENLLISCPNISAITWELFISDHRPILLRESIDSWEAAPGNKDNVIRNFMALKISQKAKIKWAIEGDENVKFFHGILNKKRSQSHIRGVMVNGTWIEDPAKVKFEFLEHFRDRFDKPLENRAYIDICLPNSLIIDKKKEMEQMITNEEVKRAVWDCGVNKSSGPNGFSFSFYRHFRPMIEEDVFGAVEYFFIHDAKSIGNGKSFVAVVKKRSMAVETEFTLSIVVDDDCFDTLKISYLGELWVLLEFESSKVKELFRHNAGAGSWFSVLQQANADFVPDGRLVWVEVGDIPFKLWTGKIFRRIASKWGELLDVDNYDELNLHSKRICILSKVRWTPEFNEEEEEDDISVEGNFDAKPEAQEANNVFNESDVEEVLETEFDVPSGKKDNQSEDPFGLYPLLQKENINMACKVNEEVHSLSHPPGFTPEGDLFEGKSIKGNAEKVYEEKEKGENSFVNNDIGKDTSNSVNKNVESTCSGRSKKSDMPRSGGSILNLMEEVVKVRQTMGYNMEGCIKDITDIIESQGEFGETKMGFMDLNTVRSCWGNSIFEYVQSDSVGNSGGILYIWDPNSFRRNSFTRSHYFVIIRGVWLKSGIDLLIMVVYAPQKTKEKHMLWEYLAHISNSWDGKIVMMDDFNEVRHKSDRFGSNFNVHDAKIFNSFIYNAGIEEVPLGAVHSLDYGPIHFRFYRYWLEVDGFDKMVRDSWEAAPGNKDNAIRNFMGKLKFLKERIRIWLSMHKANSRCETSILKEELRVCDETIDKGMGSMEVVQKRSEILNKIHQVQKNQASEISQKAKIKWAFEGLNKKRSQSQIRGVMVNETWIEDPAK
nr:RNA-directed DNA polymerase, eukaryota [Tanacetum cinerariifolium]